MTRAPEGHHAMLTIGSLFSGIGGLELGLEAAGLGPVLWQVESDPFCRAVLARHWPHTTQHDDVRTAGAANLVPVDLICGGFPCQGLSVAGKKLGLDDPRSGLWREFARIVGELSPRFVVVENVARLASSGLDTVAGDLERSGYAVWGRIVAARDVGAPHRRERLFLVAHARDNGRQGRAAVDRAHGDVDQQPGHDAARCSGRDRGAVAHTLRARWRESARPRCGEAGRTIASIRGVPVADADGDRVRNIAERRQPHPTERSHGEPLHDGAPSGRAAQPCVGGSSHGLSRRVELPSRWPAGRGERQHTWETPRARDGVEYRRQRLRALGNAVVPQVARLVGELVRLLDATATCSPLRTELRREGT